VEGEGKCITKTRQAGRRLANRQQYLSDAAGMLWFACCRVCSRLAPCCDAFALETILRLHTCRCMQQRGEHQLLLQSPSFHAEPENPAIPDPGQTCTLDQKRACPGASRTRAVLFRAHSQAGIDVMCYPRHNILGLYGGRVKWSSQAVGSSGWVKRPTQAVSHLSHLSIITEPLAVAGSP
jgi:hypothetical protein